MTARALENAIEAWNQSQHINRVEWDSKTIQWLQNGNVEVNFKPNTDHDSFDTGEFANFIGAELGVVVAVRVAADRQLVLVVENSEVLDMQPKFKYRWKKTMATWLENIQWLLLWIGIIVLGLTCLLLPFFVAPGYSRAFFVGIWNFFRIGLLNFVQVIAGNPAS